MLAYGVIATLLECGYPGCGYPGVVAKYNVDYITMEPRSTHAEPRRDTSQAGDVCCAVFLRDVELVDASESFQPRVPESEKLSNCVEVCSFVVVRDVS